MRDESTLQPLYEKLRTSPHWRDDFKIVSVEKVGNMPVYRVTADDQEPSTVLAILKLTELLES